MNLSTLAKLPRLSKMARLFMTVPSSAIPQERQFSQLKRRCNGLRVRTRIKSLDRDAVVYDWDEE